MQESARYAQPYLQLISMRLSCEFAYRGREKSETVKLVSGLMKEIKLKLGTTIVQLRRSSSHLLNCSIRAFVTVRSLSLANGAVNGEN
jgi:hypothetical protein